MKEYGERTAAPAANSDATVMADDSTVLAGNAAATGPKSSSENDATALTGVSGITSTAAAIMERYKQKFLKEARTIAKLDHPGIVRIHDVFEENGTAYYVMDFIEGENLNDKVKREGPLSEEKALGYIRQIGEALAYVHKRSIMHLDVKPANVIVRREDDKAILIDFGTAKQYDSEGTQTSTTPVGLSVGYAPIEMNNPGGVQTFSPETDVYSLGATLYYLVTGNNPPSASERMEMLMDGEKFELPEALSVTTANVIEQSMQARKKRIQTVSGFLDLLDTDQEKERLEAERKAAAEVEAKRHEELRLEREKEEAERKRVAEETKRKEALQMELDTLDHEKKRIEEKSAKKKKIVRWALGGLIALMAAVFFIVINNRPNYHNDVSYTASSHPITTITGNSNGHDFVDLGISVKWATCNVGAAKAEECGDVFPWGVDAAKDNWGGSWRMPTEAEWRQLIVNCKWVYTPDYNGTKGYIVTSKVPGYTSNSIFLPSTMFNVAGISYDTGGAYWSSSLKNSDPENYGSSMEFSYNKRYGGACISDRPRHFLLSVRPVID